MARGPARDAGRVRGEDEARAADVDLHDLRALGIREREQDVGAIRGGVEGEAPDPLAAEEGLRQDRERRARAGVDAHEAVGQAGRTLPHHVQLALVGLRRVVHQRIARHARQIADRGIISLERLGPHRRARGPEARQQDVDVEGRAREGRGSIRDREGIALVEAPAGPGEDRHEELSREWIGGGGDTRGIGHAAVEVKEVSADLAAAREHDLLGRIEQVDPFDLGARARAALKHEEILGSGMDDHVEHVAALRDRIDLQHRRIVDDGDPGVAGIVDEDEGRCLEPRRIRHQERNGEKQEKPEGRRCPTSPPNHSNRLHRPHRSSKVHLESPPGSPNRRAREGSARGSPGPM